VESLSDFWMLVWEFTKVKASIHPRYAITDVESTRLTPSPKWFPEARLNFAQNILESGYAPKDKDKTPILTMVREDKIETEEICLSQLCSRVGRLANALRREGVQPLDRVACVGSNSINTFTVFLAAASIGAIFTCCSPEMGEKGILDRFMQVKAKLLFADDWIVYNGKRISCLPKASRVARELRKHAGLQVLVAMPRFDEKHADRLPDGSQSLQSFVEGVSDSLSFVQVVFTHPLVIVYSSGTTGQPKCLVHTVGGVLLKQKVEQILCTEMDENSVYLQYTTVCHPRIPPARSPH
jgi:acetoacetyl-CoA synthetase